MLARMRRGRGVTREPFLAWLSALSFCAAALATAALGAVGCGKPAPKAPPQTPVAPAQPAPAPGAVLPFAPVPPILVRGVGFESPESVLYDEMGDVYLVSNVNGGLADADGNGFISRLGPDGTVLNLKWIDGKASGVVLDAPKGMALVGDKLYVADINVLRSFDRKSGLPLGKVAIVSATFLNDVSAGPSGTLYVSDTGFGKIQGLADVQKTGSDAIYTVDPRGVAAVLVKGTELGQPNGLLADNEGVWVVNLAGQLSRVTVQGQRHVVASLPGTGLDGLALLDGGRLVVSSWETSTVYISKAPPAPAGTFDAFIADLNSPADVGYDPKRRQLLVPLFKENAVYIQQVPAAEGWESAS